VHYTAITPRAAAAVQQSFTPPGGGHSHSPPSPPANSGCEAGETAVKSHSNVNLADQENLEICVTDQFGDPLNNVAVTEEVTTPGSFPGGADHDGDGRFEHDHGTTNAAGIDSFDVENFNATPGSATITSCVETEPTTTATGHGCANETLKDTLTISWATTPTQVFLAFSGTATNAGDPCRTGATIANGVVGQRETLVVCTFDSQGNPVSTEVDTTRLQWTITGAHGNDLPSVRFVGTPPQETGSNAQATVEIEDIGPGDNFVDVTLLDVNGGNADSFFVEKDVAGGGQKGDCAKLKKKIKNLKNKRRLARASGNLDKVKKFTKRIRRTRRALRRCRANA
jgi:hypothetical protein